MASEDTTNGSIDINKITVLQLSDIVTAQKELSCVNCSKFLWPPIMLGKIGNICGNCWKNDSHGFIRNVALEKTLEKLSIRCMNSENGCNVRKNYKEMAQHNNEQCIHRSFSCLINLVESCAWSGPNNKLENHIIQEHPSYIIKTEINSVFLNINVEKEEEQIQLIMLPNRNFLSLIITDMADQTLSVYVYYIDDVANEDQFSVQLNTSEYDPFNHETDKFNVINISKFNKHYGDKFRMDINTLKKFPTDSVGEYSLKLIFNLWKNETSGELLQHFECPVCKYYMREPIYQCYSGHNICELCKPKLPKCPICRSNYGSTRNFALENVGNVCYYPCLYFNRGCEQNFLGKDINRHEEYCKFRPYDCPFKENSCSWIGTLTDLPDHLKDAQIQKNHNIFFTDTARTEAVNDTNTICCLLAFGEMFKVNYKFHAHNSCAFSSVQLLGPKGKCELFSYKITMIDQSEPHKRLILRNFCQEYNSKENIFDQILKTGVIPSILSIGSITCIVKISKTKI